MTGFLITSVCCVISVRFRRKNCLSLTFSENCRNLSGANIGSSLNSGHNMCWGRTKKLFIFIELNVILIQQNFSL